jgi:hypothetical protein
VIVASKTFSATTAAHKMLGLDADSVTDGEIIDTRTDGLNNARQFVALLPRHVVCGRAIAAIVVQVRATHTGRLDAD